MSLMQDFMRSVPCRFEEAFSDALQEGGAKKTCMYQPYRQGVVDDKLVEVPVPYYKELSLLASNHRSQENNLSHNINIYELVDYATRYELFFQDCQEYSRQVSSLLSDADNSTRALLKSRGAKSLRKEIWDIKEKPLIRETVNSDVTYYQMADPEYNLETGLWQGQKGEPIMTFGKGFATDPLCVSFYVQDETLKKELLEDVERIERKHLLLGRHPLEEVYDGASPVPYRKTTSPTFNFCCEAALAVSAVYNNARRLSSGASEEHRDAYVETMQGLLEHAERAIGTLSGHEAKEARLDALVLFRDLCKGQYISFDLNPAMYRYADGPDAYSRPLKEALSNSTTASEEAVGEWAKYLEEHGVAIPGMPSMKEIEKEKAKRKSGDDGNPGDFGGGAELLSDGEHEEENESLRPLTEILDDWVLPKRLLEMLREEEMFESRKKSLDDFEIMLEQLETIPAPAPEDLSQSPWPTM